MAKTFVAASSNRMDCFDTNCGNFDYTQPFTIAKIIKPTSNVGGAVQGKFSSTNANGWEDFVRQGSVSPQFAFEMENTVTNRLAVTTVNEFATGTSYCVITTSDGTGTAAGMHIYVGTVGGANPTDQALTTLTDALGGNSILSTVPFQLGARNGTSSPGFFLNAVLQRACGFDHVFTQTERNNFFAGVAPDTFTGNLWWYELSDKGATLQPDWSTNGHTLATQLHDVSTTSLVTDVTPTLGTTGVKTLSGPLNHPEETPLIRNLTGQGVLNQIGPGVIIKFAPGFYKGLFENADGKKAIDVSNQPGTFDQDTCTLYGTSTTGDPGSWTLFSQGDSSGQVLTVNNVVANLTAGQATTFKAAAHGELSISSWFFDPVDGIFKAFGHCGNNTGPRAIYLFHCNRNSKNPTTADTWSVMNNGVAVITGSGSGNESTPSVADVHVIGALGNYASVIWYAGYRQISGGGAISKYGWAKSTNKGVSWTKIKTLVDLGASGTWDNGTIYPGEVFYDQGLNLYVGWYGSKRSSGYGSSSGGLGFFSFTDPENPTAVRGSLNPVWCGEWDTAGVNHYSFSATQTSGAFLDGTTYKFQIQAQDLSGSTDDFRGKLYASKSQIVLSTANTRTLQGIEINYL